MTSINWNRVLFVALGALCTVAVFALFYCIPVFGQACGVERADIKQLKDPLGSQIDVAKKNWQVTKTTVADLLKIPAHAKGALLKESGIRIAPVENMVYEINAVLIGFKRETDQDIHIVIADPGNLRATMIVEIPAGVCVASKNKAYFVKLQTSFQSRFGKATAKFKKLAKPQPFDVTGVGFFDFVHGQIGHATNGIELHPVLGFTNTPTKSGAGK